MNGRIRKGLALGAAATMLALVAPTGAASGDNAGERTRSSNRYDCRRWRSDDLSVVGVTYDQRLICFSESRPGKARDIGQLSGLDGDDWLVGIDFRVQDGLLYGVGNNGGLYTLNTYSAAATPVGELTIALDGTHFGVDFNPAANALRVISNTGQNLRHPFAGTTPFVTVNDGGLNYTAGTPATWVSGAAYTNNDADPDTVTTLFDVDAMVDQVAAQAPANAGSLSPTGKLRSDTTPNVGFDVYSTVRDGSAVHNEAFASLKVNDRVGFYGVDLLTGKAYLLGQFAGHDYVTSIAVPLAQR